MTTATDELRELGDDELEAVSGGLVVIAIIAILIGLPPAPPLTPFPHNPA
jgi:lactobin A/cerein 7B family class IIb bacteriocin